MLRNSYLLLLDLQSQYLITELEMPLPRKQASGNTHHGTEDHIDRGFLL